MNIAVFYFFYNLGVTYPLVRTLGEVISGPLSFMVFPLLIIGRVVYLAKQKMNTFSVVFLSLFFSWFSARLLKEVFHVIRPDQALGLSSGVPISGYSFPSEHASVFGALCMILFYFDRKFAMVGLVVAVSVMISRMIVGAHYPLDVVVGFCVGVLVAYGCTRICARILK